ncbi:hypothetical protein V1264_001218 [Littorina saxatilis]|uniref:Uncharacterized protein n=1 Tax=Littorina saxatilis TaxID=31220 RepID=A0AAN9C6J4_9CAEN
MSSQLYNAAKCLVCSLPRMGTLKSFLSTMKQTSTLGYARVNSFSTLPTSATRNTQLQTNSNSPFALPKTGVCLRQGGVSLLPQARLLHQVTPFLSASTPALTHTRGRAQIYYRPSAWKRVNKHGIERKLRTQGGIELLWRRFLKKRHVLTPFDRMLPGTHYGQILPDHYIKYNQQLVNPQVRKQLQEVYKNKSKARRVVRTK